MGAPSLSALRAIPARDLQKRVIERGDAHMMAVVDGWLFPQQTYDTHLQGKQNDVPVMLGYSADEGSAMGAYGLVGTLPQSPTAYTAEIRKRYGDLAEQYLRVYPADRFEDSAYAAVRDGMYGWGTQTIARLSGKVSSNTYLYHMAHIPPRGSMLAPNSNRPMGAHHAADLAYFLNNYNLPDPRQGALDPATVRDADRHLANVMSDYYVAFIKTGIPRTPGLPEWKPYRLASKDYMKFSDGGAVPSRELLPGTWELWDKINARRRANGIFWNYQSGLNGFTERQ
jgi:para-nitrobenzyl esterase